MERPKTGYSSGGIAGRDLDHRISGTSHYNAHGKCAANSHWPQPQSTASDSANRGAIRTEPMLQHATDTVSFFQAMAA